MQTLRSSGLDDVLVVAGGTIPPEDTPTLKQLGIAEVFPSGSETEAIVRFIRDNVG